MLLAITATAAAVLTSGACRSSGSDAPDFPSVVTLGMGNLFPTIANSTLAVGENRVAMIIIDREDNRVLGAAMHLRYYNLNGSKPQFLSESNARFIPIDLSYIDEQSNGEKSPAGNSGVYVSYANFDEGGQWGVEITITRDGKAEPSIPFRFTVLDDAIEPAMGDAAPASVQATTATDRIEDIDSSNPPRAGMHDMTVADALKTGRPLVIAFATPAFCRSRTCGPVMDTVMDPLAVKYAGRALFIHIEPYVLADERNNNIQNPVPAVREWRLQSEPWIFVVDGDGRITAKFEGIVAEDEVESVLSLALGGSSLTTTPAPTP
jgi:hypothetical protein